MGGARRGNGYYLQRTILFLVPFVAFASVVPALSSDTVTLTLSGPESFVRNTGAPSPVVRSFNVPSAQGTFTLRVINGTGGGDNAVSLAVVDVNGTTILKANDFNQNVSQISRTLTNLVQGVNTLSVEVKSIPSSYLTLSITGDFLLNLTITEPPAGAEVLSDHVTVRGSYVAYTGNVAISVNGVAAVLDGGTFTATNVPIASGSGTLTATITTGDGIQDQDTISVTGNRPPAAAAGPDQTVLVGDRVTLDGRNSYDPEGALITYGWSLVAAPSGSLAALDNPSSVLPSFTPDFPGTYVSSLVVSDGQSNSLPDNVSVFAQQPNVPPTANAGPDQSVVTGTIVQLDGRGSFDPEAAMLSFFWQILSRPPGSNAALDFASTSLPTFLADESGLYVLRLIVNDGQIDSSPDNVSVVAAVPNAAPVAIAGTDDTVSRNAVIRLDGTQSFDPDNDPLSFAWSIVSRPAGGTGALDNAASPTPSMPADGEGDFVFRLVVNDGQVDSAPDTVVVTSVNDPPVADAGPDLIVPRNTTLTLDGGGSHDANGDPLTYAWSILSAPAGSTATIGNPSAVTPLFTPVLAGTYVIRLVVSDGTTQGTDDMAITATLLPVTVPDAEGLTQAAAQSAIAAAGLAAGTVTQANSPTIPAGNVISQSPVPGSIVPEGTAVDLVVSLGPVMVTVPNVVSMPQASAQSTLIAAGLSSGSVTTAYSATFPVGNVISQDPVAGASVLPGSSVAMVVSLGPVMVTVPDLFGKPQGNALSMLATAGLVAGTVSSGYSDTVIPGNIMGQTPASGATAPQGFPVALTVSQGAEPLPLPPDPTTVASPVDPTMATDMLSATSFLYTGANPIQAGVVPGTIELRRAAVVRGQVRSQDNTALSGVKITVLNHPEYGQTVSRDDGMFDMAVNGGGLLTIDFRKGGYLSAQRQVAVPWQDYASVPDVVLPAYDTRITTIDLASVAPVQVARGSVVTDSDGTRQATLFFAQGTQATIVMPDNSTRSMPSFNVRATEYTVGPNGPRAMPAELPPASAYTYCAEYSVDEAVSAGADTVWFSQPVITYVENFLRLPVGIPVPSGYYDRKKGVWIPSDSGLVIKIVGVTGGKADIDKDGNGIPDDVASMGITDAEREKLSGLYPLGTSLWRVPVTHFSPWDSNLGMSPPSSALPSKAGFPTAAAEGGTQSNCSNPVATGSMIECRSMTLGETIPVTGTPIGLTYRSDRVPGRRGPYTLNIPLSTSTLPAGLLRIEVEILVAGRRISRTFLPTAHQSYSFEWDGLDSYGRTVQGIKEATVRVGYAYRGVYMRVERFGYNGNGIPISTVPGRQDVILWKDWHGTIGSFDARGPGLGAWTLSAHHVYDPFGRAFYGGDGTHRRAETVWGTISTVAGTGQTTYNGDSIPADNASLSSPYNVAFAPDGGLYIADTSHSRIRRVGLDGIITTVAGTGLSGHGGDGGPATQATFKSPIDVAVGPDGSFYVVEYSGNYVRKVTPDGIISTIAGTGQRGFGGDGGPATAAVLNVPTGVAVGPDGSVYITDQWNGRIRRIGPDGIMTTVAGNGGFGFGGDGGQAVLASLNYPRDVAVGPDGSLYIADMYNARIRRVGTNGVISTVAGNGYFGFSGDGWAATDAMISYPRNVSAGTDGSLYIVDYENNRIRRVSPEGIITTVAGNGQYGYNGDGAPATASSLASPDDAIIGPDGALYIADYLNHRVRRVARPLPGYSPSDVLISSEDGSALFVFDYRGRHLRTINTFTGVTIHRFDYDSGGRLGRITDQDNNATIIERDPAGTPLAIVAPGGQRSTISLDGNGYLETFTDPGGNATSFLYGPMGLLTSLTDPNGNLHGFEYDSAGRLLRDDDPEGGYKTLGFADSGAGNYTMTLGTALGRTSRYKVERLSTGASRYTDTGPTESRTQEYAETDGAVTLTSSDGSVTTVIQRPDPRFGMEAPVPASTTVRTPGGLLSTTTVSRAATLSDSSDLLSLVSQTDTTVVNGRSWSQLYSASSKQFTVTTPMDRQTVTAIDNQGRMLRVNVAPTVDNVTFGYDSNGRLSQTGQGGNTWGFAYDALNRLTSVSDPLTHSVQYAYDNADRVSQVILPSGRTYGFLYDNNGNLTQITMPSGAIHGLGYTKLNLDNSYLPPGNPPYGTQYNLDREWVRTTLPSGRVIDGGYDNGGRLNDVTFPEGAVAMSYFDNTDRVGTITRAIAPVPDNTTQTIAFSYDGFLTTRVSYSGVSSGEYRYSYNNDFNVTGIALDNVWTTLGRDNDGLLTQYGRYTITRSGPAGAPSALTDNVLSISYTYDSAGRLFTRTHTVAAIPVYQIQLGYDNVGRIAQKIETVTGTEHTFDYTYDLDGQLFEVRKDGVLVEQYGYDNNANRTSTLATTATYDDQDRLVQQGGVNYTFDVDGYLTTRGTDTFAYSARGELLSAAAGGQTISYQYDGMGRRVGKTDAAGTIQYLYGSPRNPFQLTASRDVSGILTTYFYDTAGNLHAFERGGQRYYVATDQLGTPKAVTDATGGVVKAIEYDAWGMKLGETNPAFDLPVGFAGGISNGASGLVRFGFRDYEPGTGRWLARDPILFAGRQGNLYGYTFNDPVNFVDPDGKVAPLVYFVLAKGGAIAAAYVGSKYAATFADWWNSKAVNPCGGAGSGSGVRDMNRAFGKISAIGAAEIGVFGAINAGAVMGPTVTGAVLSNPQSMQKGMDFIQSFVDGTAPVPNWAGLAGAVSGKAYDEFKSWY